MPLALGDLRRLDRTRDLSLPDWGPYSKTHLGLTHIADRTLGALMEYVFIPGIQQRRRYVPSRKGCLDFTPLDANADLSFYAIRCAMQYDTQADLRFFGDAENVRYAEIVFANHGAHAINFQLDAALGLRSESEYVRLALKRGERFLSAHRYTALSLRLPSTQMDERREGGVASAAFIERLGLGPAFTAVSGAEAHFEWPRGLPAQGCAIGVRYALSGARPATVLLTIGTSRRRLSLQPTGSGLAFESFAIRWADFAAGETPSPHMAVRMEAPSPDGALHLDGFFALPGRGRRLEERQMRPLKATGDLASTVEGSFAAVQSPLCPDRVYGLLAQAPCDMYVWTLRAQDMDKVLEGSPASRFWTRDRVVDNGPERLIADFRPLYCRPGDRTTVRAVAGVASSVPQLKRLLHTALDGWSRAQRRILAHHRRTAFRVADHRFRTGIETPMAATLTSLSYPQNLGAETVRIFNPGAFYPTLYLWDAGMQGLGLMEYAPHLALQGLNTYLTDPDDPRALILHGTVLPTQVYLYWELYQRSGSRDMLRALYARMRRYYRFMVGKDGSLMDPFDTGLLCPWGYFYNSAGWDDYPPQAYVDRNGLGHTMSPVANTAHGIRCAKLMALAANELGIASDAAEYRADAERMSRALMAYSWDESSGYFSYVVNAGKRKLEYRPGVNFNCGLDGVSPLVAGVTDRRIARRLIAHCRSPKELWTRMGLSTVDQSAPYYAPGYWNGSVWVAHQWFMFRALLDYGESALALRLARAIVQGWQDGLAASGGQTFEAIDIRTGVLQGTPYFSALAVPVVTIYNAFAQRGRLTGGFDTVIRNLRFDGARCRMSAHLSCPSGGPSSGLIAVMGRKGRYEVTIGTKEYLNTSDSHGVITCKVQLPQSETRIEIRPVR